MNLGLSFIASLTIFLAFTVSAFCQTSEAEYVGRYSDGKDFAVYFERTPYGLTLRPVLWTATQLLRRTNGDSFVVVDRASRAAEFSRDANGRITGVSIRGMDGEGLRLKKESGPVLPIELLLDGRNAKAANEYLKRGRGGERDAMAAAEKVFQRFPTKRAFVVSFLRFLKPQFRDDSKYFSLLGYALVSIADRRSARASFLSGYKLDPANAEIVSGLARLNVLPASYKSQKEGWSLPFSLSDVFERPTAAEISRPFGKIGKIGT